MATVKLLLNKSRMLTSGKYPLVFQLLHQRKKRLIYTGFKIDEDLFDFVNQVVIYKRYGDLTNKEIKKINNELQEIRKRITGSIRILEELGKEYCVTNIVARFRMISKDDYLFYYFDSRILLKKEMGNRYIGTIVAYRNTRNSLERFFGRPDILLSEITAKIVHEYLFYLKKLRLSPNTISSYLRNFRTIFNYAIKSGYESLDINPFRGISTRVSKTVKRAMERDKLQQITRIDLTNRPAVDLARDVFMFSFYARGMSFIDLLLLRKSDIVDNVIMYKRCKTGQVLLVNLTEQLEVLIKKYRNDSPYIFPFISSDDPEKQYKEYQAKLRCINNGLKALALTLGIEMKLTTYVARHSWATQAKERGAAISVISEALGHTSENTTAIYLKQFDRSVLDHINKMVSNLDE